MSSADYQTVREKFTQAGQGHVFQFWDELATEERDELLTNLRKIDVDRVNRIYTKATTSPPKSKTASIKPLPDATFASTISHGGKVKAWEERGLRLIAQNKVGVILLAGGQGELIGQTPSQASPDALRPSCSSPFLNRYTSGFRRPEGLLRYRTSLP